MCCRLLIKEKLEEFPKIFKTVYHQAYIALHFCMIVPMGLCCSRCIYLQVMVGICYLCSVWGEPLAQTAQSFMPAFIHGSDRNLKQVNSHPLLLLLRIGTGE
jgi:hypothetical protein